jgi:7-dehydrocholesterol reductase
MRPLHATVLPLLLMAVCPVGVFFLWDTLARHGGSLTEEVSSLAAAGWAEMVPRPTTTALGIVLGFAALQALLMALLPGRTRTGPVTPAGDRVAYRVNGFAAWLISNALFLVGGPVLGWFPPGIVYDQFGPILAVCCCLGLVASALLYLKGVWFPSGADRGRSGNPVFDFFWGVELHPRFGRFDLKQFANCRLGMMSWSLILLSFAAKQYELEGRVSNAMLVSVGLQLVYVAKFFWWEGGYLATLDVMHDRFGFYLCWGVLVWLPCVYTSQALYLVRQPGDLGTGAAVALSLAGLTAIGLNYDADAQRQRVRATAGNCRVWGRRPELIAAKYRTADGQVRENLLLVSGWWGVARHFHYLPEMGAAVAWTLPCGFAQGLPWFYVVYLAILLVHRSFRDEVRCREKYGPYWQEYCKRVPYRIVPGLF